MEGEFNLFLKNGIESRENMKEGAVKSGVERLIKMHKEQEGKTVLTHGDISVLNILVKGGKVVGLIGFEMAGFYPEYFDRFLPTPHRRKFDTDNLWKKKEIGRAHV